MQPAGKRNRLVTLARPSQTSGDAQITQNVIARVWASFRELGGTDRSGVVAEAAAEFGILYRGDVTPKVNVLMDDRRFEIESVSDQDGLRRELLLVATEKRST